MFTRLGNLIARRPAVLVTVWLALLLAGAVWAVRGKPVPPAEVGSFLPPNAPHNRASQIVAEAFPRIWYNSVLVIIAHRAEGVTETDFAWMGELAEAARREIEAELRERNLHARADGSIVRLGSLAPNVPFLRHRLVSPDGQAAIALVNLPTNFISEGTIAAVEIVQQLLKTRNVPAGLTVEITGSAGIGHDYFLATQEAADRTTWVTIGAVLVILVLVYRSPVGALVPLLSIGASVFLAFVLLSLLSHVGWEVSAMERIFCVVLMFGAGVDYALFWIARYREELTADGPDEIEADGGEPIRGEKKSRAAAALAATRGTGPAILASGATTICGLSTMLVADLEPSKNAGRVLGVALLVALAAALTLAPALARWLGKWLFWPMGTGAPAGLGQRWIWPRLARVVTVHPWPVLALGTLILTIPALWAFRIEPRFDALQELPPNTSSARGMAIADQHFTPGQLYASTLLVVYPDEKAAPEDLKSAAASLTDVLKAESGVVDVYSLDQPLGRGAGTATPGFFGPLLSSLTQTFYQGETQDGRVVLRFEILTRYMPFSPEAIETYSRLRARASEHVAGLGDGRPTPKIMLSGLTSYIIGVKEVVGPDQRRVMLLATMVIGVIVLAMVRDLALTLFMLLSTWLTYGATITLADLFFVQFMGLHGLDWKVRMILFVVVVAVGQDYNIFLVSRLLRARGDMRVSAEQAIVRTGSVISSCGIIMAATLGSLWAGGLSLLQQLGFALATGILIDTFFVRPLLIPSFFLVLRGRRRAATE